MSKKIVRYIKKNSDRKVTESEIKKFLDKPMDMYFGLSTYEFLRLNPKVNEKIVLENLRQMFFGEIMGA